MVFTYPHSAEGTSVEPVSRLVVEQQSAADVHGVGALAHYDGVLGNVRLHCLEYGEVVQRQCCVA